MIESPVMCLLRLFHKIHPNQSKLDSTFNRDFGLDSLDIVEITAALEDEFCAGIPDVDSNFESSSYAKIYCSTFVRRL